MVNHTVTTKQGFYITVKYTNYLSILYTIWFIKQKKVYT